MGVENWLHRLCWVRPYRTLSIWICPPIGQLINASFCSHTICSTEENIGRKYIVQVGNDQVMAQSERNSHSKNWQMKIYNRNNEHETKIAKILALFVNDNLLLFCLKCY